MTLTARPKAAKHTIHNDPADYRYAEDHQRGRAKLALWILLCGASRTLTSCQWSRQNMPPRSHSPQSSPAPLPRPGHIYVDTAYRL